MALLQTVVIEEDEYIEQEQVQGAGANDAPAL